MVTFLPKTTKIEVTKMGWNTHLAFELKNIPNLNVFLFFSCFLDYYPQKFVMSAFEFMVAIWTQKCQRLSLVYLKKDTCNQQKFKCFFFLFSFFQLSILGNFMPQKYKNSSGWLLFDKLWFIRSYEEKNRGENSCFLLPTCKWNSFWGEYHD